MTKQIISVILAIITITTSVPARPQETSFWQPSENYSMDYTDPDSSWSFDRCRETEHFYIFWEKGFGSDPSADSVPENMRVDISDLAQKLEQFWQTETQSLGFSDTMSVNGFKMQVYLLYQDDRVATGSGYDDAIGALWITPMTCQPVGSTIAHEVGHCFQYMVSCRQNSEGYDITQSGFRYGYPGSRLAAGDSGTYRTGDDPTAAGTVTTYNKYTGKMGWRYGFVALKSDGTRVYSPMYSESSATVSFDVPDDTYLVYFVVMGAPEEYACHAWDDTELTDVQAPYKIKLS